MSHNPTTAAAIGAESSFQLLPILNVHPTPDNPRKSIDESAPEFLDLVASVRANGILQPVLARPHPTKPGHYDLRAGERRFRAAWAAELPIIPAIVREMDDKLAMEITVIENLQRQDLSPLEESRGVAALRATGHSDEEIAAEIGKSRAWVSRRASLTQLTAVWESAALRLSLKAAVLELIARFPADVQIRIADRAGLHLNPKNEQPWQLRSLVGPDSLNHVRQLAAEEQMNLSSAPWKLTDETLCPAAGPCTACPKRSSCQAELFDEMEPSASGKATKGDQCLDGECWKVKASAHAARRLEAAQKKHTDAVAISLNYGNHGIPTGAMSHSDFQEVKKADDGAIKAVVVDGPDAGSIRWIRPYNAHKAARAAARAAGEKPQTAPLAERQAQLERRRLAYIAGQIRERLQESDCQLATHWRTPQGLLALASIFGIPHSSYDVVEEQLDDGADDEPGDDWEEKSAQVPWEHATAWKRANDKAFAACLDLTWKRLRTVFHGRLAIHSPSEIRPRTKADILGILDVLDESFDAFMADAVTAIPTPKGWAKEAGATPPEKPAAKKVAKKAVKKSAKKGSKTADGKEAA